MVQPFENSYFYVLPNEVLIKILSEIDTFSLLNFCQVYDCECFLKDRSVIRTIDLYKKYALQDLSFSRKIALEHVTTLNINCLYWIPAAKLRNFIRKLVNLKTLYAIHTNLSLTPSDTEAYSNLKIEKLGVSLGRQDILGSHKIPTVETLYISIVLISTLASCAILLETVFPQVQNVWIDVEEPCGREIILHYLNGQNKRKIFCQVKAPIPNLNFDHYWLTTYYQNRRACQPYVMCSEKLTLKRPDIKEFAGVLGESWKVLDELHCAKPYGPKDARRLYLNQSTLEDIRFEELNFYHAGPVCNERCRQAVKHILKSATAKRLQKLCVMMCLFHNDNAQELVNVQDPLGFARKRIGIENSAKNHPAEDIFRNFEELEHLEVYVCHQTSHHSAVQAYPLISLFTNLQSLTLQVPITLDGSFLTDVLKSCNRLRRLLITSLGQHEKLNVHLGNAISSASALNDLRFENHRIQMDRLLERLSLLKNLERVVLICNDINKFSAASLRQFLDANPRLTFLYFLIRGCTDASVRLAQQTLNTYRRQHPSRVFLVRKSDIDRLGYPIPDVHYHEMVKSENNVASLYALHDFVTF